MFFLSGRVRTTFLCLVLFAAAGFGQTIIPDQTSLTFTAQPGSLATSTVLNITSSGSALPLTVTAVTYNGSGSWLSVSPNYPATPVALMVSADAAALSVGTYSGAIVISTSTAGVQAVTVPVSFVVGAGGSTTSTLVASPALLSFAGQAGGVAPTAQAINVTSSTAGTTFAVSASTNDVYSWLHVSTTNATVPAAINVTVTTGGMPIGSYTGTITLTPTSGSTVTVPVSLNLSSGTTISASVSSLQFYYQIGLYLPATQAFVISGANSAALAVAVTATTNDAYNWLSVTPVTTTTPQTITVSVSSYQMPAGVYKGNVHISAPNAANAVIDIPVTLTVNANPLLVTGANPSTFVYQTGSSLPAAQSVAIGTSSGTLNYTVTTSTSDGSNWLAVSPLTGQTPQTLTIAVNPASLASGNYTGTVTVTAPGAANSPIAIPISLSVNTASTLTVSTQAVVLNYQLGVATGQIFAQSLYVDSTGGSVQFSVSSFPSTCGENWLNAFPATATTPATITVGASPIGLYTPQVCTGTVVLSQAGGVNPIQIPVTLNISNSRLFNVTPLSLNFSNVYGADAAAAQTISLATTDGSAIPITYTASTTLGATWLRVSSDSATTPVKLSVVADGSNLSVGSYTGTIIVSSTSLTSSVQIPVTLKVTAVTAAAVSPALLSFTQVVGGAAPAAQNITLSSGSSPLSYGTSTSTVDLNSWLSIQPVEGTTPTSISVRVNGGNLTAGVYRGYITLNLPGATNSPLVVAVTLNMVSSAVPAISADHSSLTFSYQQTAAVPAAQAVNVTSSGAAVNVAAAVTAGASWLTVSPASATTPGAFSVSVSPAALTAGGYDGAITFTPASGTAITVSVHLTVTAAPVAATAITAVANAASAVRGPIAPGEIVTIMGTALGPATGTGLVLDSNGRVSTSVAGTQVFFGSVAAPILYTSATQINAVVPYEISGSGTVAVAVVYQGTRSSDYTMQLAATAPGIFTTAQTGRGQGAILNQDNSYNSQSPAARGDVVQVFGTGEGITSPPNTTGGVTPDASYQPVGAVTAIVGGMPAEVTYKGSAPGNVAGLFQVNVRIPQGVVTGNVNIAISVGGVQSQSGVTVSVK